MTLKNYYVNDFPSAAAANKNIFFKINNTEIPIIGKALIPMDGESRVLVFYVPNTNFTFEILELIIENFHNLTKEFDSTSTTSSSIYEISVGDIRNHINTYSKQFYIYFEECLSKYEINQLNTKCIEKSLIVGLRGPAYQKSKLNNLKPYAFISHDSRDKEKIARVIFNGLSNRLIPI